MPSTFCVRRNDGVNAAVLVVSPNSASTSNSARTTSPIERTVNPFSLDVQETVPVKPSS